MDRSPSRLDANVEMQSQMGPELCSYLRRLNGEKLRLKFYVIENEKFCTIKNLWEVAGAQEMLKNFCARLHGWKVAL